MKRINWTYFSKINLSVLIQAELIQIYIIKIGLNNTFKDATIKFCQCLDLPTSVIGTHLIFLKNASKLDPFNDKVTIEQMGLKDNDIITVIDCLPIIGA